jgi:DNA (cytosine-5)-methyltransferase 1
MRRYEPNATRYLSVWKGATATRSRKRDVKPRLLDLFCGAGGAAVGYARAGFSVVGVDINPQPNYPFEFHQADVMGLAMHVVAAGFDAIHASPPCQAYSTISATNGYEYPDLVASIRTLLKGLGGLWVIENVVGAPLATSSTLFGSNGITLCGSMFDLEVPRGQLRRHRIFETSIPLIQPECRHRGWAAGVYGQGSYAESHRKVNGLEAQALMGIDWMTQRELTQAIPPAYTEFIGAQLLAYVDPPLPVPEDAK